MYTVGWVDFGLFKNFMHLHVVCGSPRYNTKKYQISLTFVLTTNERYHFKGPYFQKKIQRQNIKIKNLVFWKNDNLISVIHSEKIQS